MSQPHYFTNTNIPGEGFCQICDTAATFHVPKEYTEMREHYICNKCRSVPRERALMYCIEKYYPNWRDLDVHESSPARRGASVKLATSSHYNSSQFLPGFPFGREQNGIRNENIEKLSFPDRSFDIFVTQDVMEHVFHPDRAFAEIARVLRPGGAHIFTVPLMNRAKPSERAARVLADGKVEHLLPAEYHGNPVSEQGSLVTMRWGRDIGRHIHQATGLFTTIHYLDNFQLGIRADYIEVLVTHKD